MLWTDDRSLAASRRNMDVNYFGAADMSHAILRAWLAPEAATGAGSSPKHLVFTASTVAFFAVVGYAPYSPSKWALRGLADTLVQEVQLYPDNPVRVHVVYPGTILSPGFERENRTKPDITLLLEKDDPQLTPDEVAEKAIRGLEKGQQFVTVTMLGEAMRWGVLGGSPRNNWVVDTFMSCIVSFAWFFILIWFNGEIRGFAKKHGHPSTYPKKG